MTNITESEMSVLNDDHIRLNYQAMCEKILNNVSDTLKAVSYLDDIKLKMYGFDFKIHYNNDRLPDAIVFMIHGMRQNLVRYGNVLFLDSQKRQFNKTGWPYIGPAIMTNDNKVGVTSESIVLIESIEMYTWILQVMAIMETRWIPSNVRLIFAYGLITTRLLFNLGIEDTCVLHGHFWHLLKDDMAEERDFWRILFLAY